MAKIAIVYHSGWGHTKAIAEAVLRGVQSVRNASATLISVDELPAADKDKGYAGRWKELGAADAIIFGAPTYMGDISAKFKEFMEHSSHVWFRQEWKDKLAGGFTNSGGLSGDKLHSMTSLVVFAGQHGMNWVSQGVMPTAYRPEQPAGLNRLGSWLGVMSQSDNGPAETTPPEGDRKTAELYGQRIALAAIRWNCGVGKAN